MSGPPRRDGAYGDDDLKHIHNLYRPNIIAMVFSILPISNPATPTQLFLLTIDESATMENNRKRVCIDSFYQPHIT